MEPAASHAISMAVVRRVCRSCFNSRGHLHRSVICQANHAVQRGFGDRWFVFFVVIGTVRLAALNVLV